MADRGLGRLAFAVLIASLGCSIQAPPPRLAPPAPLAERTAPAAPRRAASELMTGDECLFCHRGAIATAWEGNLHNRTVHDVGVAPADVEAPHGAELGLGAREPKHWLRTTQRYGVLALRTASGRWDEDVFGASCAGCHASGVDPGTGAFAAVSLDCFVCHGDVTLEHTNDPARARLSPRRSGGALELASICGQCHLRGGRSRSTGLPWPSGFIAGDTLLDDFEFDFSDGALAALSLADRHIAENVRDIALRKQAEVTCLSCHSIHGESSRKHRNVLETELCFTCHVRGERRSRHGALMRSNPTCDVAGGA